MEELRRRAQELAASHETAGSCCNTRLLDCLADNARTLREAHRRLRHAQKSGEPPRESSTWLLDNHYLVQEHIRVAQHDLPRRYGRGLPRLNSGLHQGLPRVYALALELVLCLDGGLKRKHLCAFIDSYQSVSPLTLGELWAVPLMLRLAAIETLRRVAERVVDCRATDDEATIARAMRDGIATLRVLGAFDWKHLVETESAVEQILRRDPANVYPQMDFESRDECRHAVERLARQSCLTEQQVAQLALERAERADARQREPDCRPTPREAATQRHVGYYLVDRGRAAFERAIGYRSTWRELPARLAARAPLAGYLGTILVVWSLTIFAAAWAAQQCGTTSLGMISRMLLLVLFAGGATQFAVAVVNWLCSLSMPSKPLMRLDFSRGIPPGARTLVAVPALLTGDQEIRTLVDQLELRYLGNRDRNLAFALVTDFPDASQQTLPRDRRLLRVACAEIERLNRRYRRAGGTVFFLLHRPRQWNPQQGVWMGEERKRGKLAALNRLLLTGRNDAFSTVVGDLSCLDSTRYVITLDADTRLPPETARRLVGCMAHPLNWPHIDAATQTVTEGYAILQPRAGVTIADASRSCFSHLLAGDPGLDPYTRQASDVYQDLFGRGSFIGKGIYDVRAFERVTAYRFPANRILSHDLIEGCFAGSGLLGDAELFEGVPTRWLADQSRRHRWIRGDWQIASWLWRRVPSPRGPVVNPLSALSRWKIFDNLRRSVSPLSLFCFLIAGCLVAPAMIACWAALTLVVWFGPTLIGTLSGLLRKPRDVPCRLHVQDQAVTWFRALAAEAVNWCALPHVAYSHTDAIVRTLYRLYVSHRKLLEWTTASDSDALAARAWSQHLAVMWPCTAISLGLTLIVSLRGRDALCVAAPVILSWLLGPTVAWWISRPRCPRTSQLTAAQMQLVRRWARHTWHYFDAFPGPKHHWLAPDNIQDVPRPLVAHRTSPTNIGMSLLADLAAWDLGYLSSTSLLNRAGRTTKALSQLERYRGHFYNWYDTRTLAPILPRYVSSVDSGNLWGALIVFRAGLQELPDRPLISERLLEGLRDTLNVILSLRAPHATTASCAFNVCLARLRLECSRPFSGGARNACRRLCRIRALAASLASAASDQPQPIKQWTRALVRQSGAIHRDIARLAFWTRFPKITDALIPSLLVTAVPMVAPAASLSAAAAAGSVARGKSKAAPVAIARVAPTTSAAEARHVLGRLHREVRRLDRHCSLRQLAAAAQRVAHHISRLQELAEGKPDANRLPSKAHSVLRSMRRSAQQAAAATRTQSRQISRIRKRCGRFCRMDFRFLYHPQRKALAIGFDVEQERRDHSYYGFLASEARLTSFLAVSHGQLPLDHWFSLGRTMAIVDTRPVLLSWAGSMFEYLMPLLFMPSTPGTMLDRSCRGAIERHIRYARQRSIPWGISESCHQQFNDALAYHYRMFGAPGLGLMRGLAEHLVVAPYASALAAMVAPQEALQNLQRLQRLGCLGPSGFYDALDYTASNDNALRPTMCQTVMVHHSAMTLLALTNVLLDSPMHRRFLKTRLHAAYELVLQERWPHAIRPIDPQ